MTYGCRNHTDEMWVSGGCRATFTCNGNRSVFCGTRWNAQHRCSCTIAPLEDEIWVRKMSDGSVAAALTNLGTESKTVGVCLSAVGLGGRGRKVAVRDVWQRKDLGTVVDGKFSARISSHDTLLIRLTPSSVE